MQHQAFLVVEGQLYRDHLEIPSQGVEVRCMSHWGAKSLSFLRKYRKGDEPLAVAALIYPRTTPDGRIDWQASQIGNVFPLGKQPSDLRVGMFRVVGRCKTGHQRVRVQVRSNKGGGFWLTLQTPKTMVLSSGLVKLEGEVLDGTLQVQRVERCRASARRYKPQALPSKMG